MSKTTQNILPHTPFPDIFSFRRWDFKLLERYKPFFMKSDKACHLCGLGPCKPMKSPQPPFAKGGREGGFAKGVENEDLKGASEDGLGKCGID